MTDLSTLKIGDTIPIAVPIDERVRTALRGVRFKRGQLARAEATGKTNEIVNRARLILTGQAERAERLADPVEQAKAYLRRRGFRVFNAEVSGGPEGQFYIGDKLHGETDMLAFAERRGWARGGG